MKFTYLIKISDVIITRSDYKFLLQDFRIKHVYIFGLDEECISAGPMLAPADDCEAEAEPVCDPCELPDERSAEACELPPDEPSEEFKIKLVMPPTTDDRMLEMNSKK